MEVLGTYCVYLAIGVLTLSPGGSDSKASVYNVGDLGSIPGSGSSLEKEMATHSRILVWEVPRTEEPGYSPWGRTELNTIEATWHSRMHARIREKCEVWYRKQRSALPSA